MELYAILRRQGWRTPDDLREAAVRSTVEGDRTPDEVAWIRSYVTAESDGTVGTICIGDEPEAIALHAKRADLPVDDSGRRTVIVRPDPAYIAS